MIEEELMRDRWYKIKLKSRSKKYTYHEMPNVCPREDGSCCGDPDLCSIVYRVLNTDNDHVEYWDDQINEWRLEDE